MIGLILSAAVSLARPAALDAWRWSIEDMGWTWRAASSDQQIEVFTRPVAAADRAQLWVRTERYDGRWKSQTARLALDCESGKVTVVEARLYGGMNMSGEFDDSAPGEWPAPDSLIQPILRSACGS
jgi:hypothetical protein